MGNVYRRIFQPFSPGQSSTGVLLNWRTHLPSFESVVYIRIGVDGLALAIMSFVPLTGCRSKPPIGISYSIVPNRTRLHRSVHSATSVIRHH